MSQYVRRASNVFTYALYGVAILLGFIVAFLSSGDGGSQLISGEFSIGETAFADAAACSSSTSTGSGTGTGTGTGSGTGSC